MKNIEDILLESFLNRSDDPLKNLYHSFKNLFLNLRFSLGQSYKLDFLEKQIKKDLQTYFKYITDNYTDDNKSRFKKKFLELVQEIDSDLIKEIGLVKFIDKTIKVFDKEQSIEDATLKLKDIFEKYIQILSKSTEDLYKTFEDKVKENNGYEVLKNIKTYTSSISFKEFLKQQYFLKVELLKLQEYIVENKKKLLIIIEGRDSSGKSGTINIATDNLNPKYYRVEKFDVPTEYDKEHWFERYMKKMPKEGEIVFFDRSWYTRAYVEPAMGYCTEEQYNKFMNEVNDFEKKLNDKDIIIIKIWMSVSKDRQKLGLEVRKASALGYWKYSENDEKSFEKWDDYTKYINEMLKDTNTKENKWNILNANDRRLSKLQVLKIILNKFEYKDKDGEIIKESTKIKLKKLL